MKRTFLGQVVTGFFATIALGAVMAACAHDDSTLFLRGVQAPPVTAIGGVCLYTADPAAPTLSMGLLDLAFTSSYTASILVGSQLISQANHDLLRTETARVELQGATVRITDARGAPVGMPFTALGAGFVDPGSGTGASFGTLSVTLVNPAAAETLRAGVSRKQTKLLIVYFKVFGQTLGATTVESNELQFPITVCSGCLVSFPPESVDPAKAKVTGKPNCSATATAGGTTMLAVPCAPGQDQPVDCRTCQSNPACDPTVP